ncbi:MAG: hypothetical protein H6719_37735 [Sandaracinaceae bacterium]|nr:hypothetical protein [Sandaracinaceae bacterium]
MSARGSNAIFWVIGGIVALMLAAAGTMLWVSLSRDAARGYIPPEQREEPRPP